MQMTPPKWRYFPVFCLWRGVEIQLRHSTLQLSPVNCFKLFQSDCFVHHFAWFSSSNIRSSPLPFHQRYLVCRSIHFRSLPLWRSPFLSSFSAPIPVFRNLYLISLSKLIFVNFLIPTFQMSLGFIRLPSLYSTPQNRRLSLVIWHFSPIFSFDPISFLCSWGLLCWLTILCTVCLAVPRWFQRGK